MDVPEKIIKSLNDILESIHGCQSMINSFILASCLIDTMSGYVNGKNSTEEAYEDFIRKYFNKDSVVYEPIHLYREFRCKLVHRYSTGGYYLLTKGKYTQHLEYIDGKQILNLENLLEDISKVIKLYSKHITKPNNPKEKVLQQKAIFWHSLNQLAEFEEVKNEAPFTVLSISVMR